MSGQVIYNVPHAMPFGWAIAVYFFCTGLSAGSFFISVLARLMGLTAYKKLGRVAAILAPLLLIIAPAFLIADLEQPVRFYRVLINFNPTSPISYGSFLLTLYPISAILYAYFLFRDDIKGSWVYKLGGALGLNKANADKMTQFFGILGIPLAVAVHGYTGFIVGIVRARELWNTALMPILFLVSAIVSGIALVMLVNILVDRKNAETNRTLHANLSKILGGVILLDLFLVLCDVLVLSSGQAGAREAAHLLLSGAMAPWFLGVEIGLGGIIPLAIVFNKRTANRIGWQALASVLVLVGVLAMRFVLVIGGQMTPLS
jgi:tetrathionate reductase subunit C